MATLLEAMDLARSWLGEREAIPEVFTNAFLLPISKEVYRDIQRLLEKAGFPQLSAYVEFNILPGVISVTEGDPGYPLDVIKPVRLWERDISGVFADFVLMEKCDPEHIPRAQTVELTHWDWAGDSIEFIGSTATRTVRVKYDRYLADLVDENSVLEIKDSVGPMSMGIAAGAALSRGSPMAKDAQVLYVAAVDDLVAREMGNLEVVA